jgi:hypothetical protein
MTRKTPLIVITLAILFTMSCSLFSTKPTDTPRVPQRDLDATGTAEAGPSAPEAVALTNFEGWASVPYRNVRTRLLTNDDAYAKVSISAEFRDTIDSPWIEKNAVGECQHVGEAWRCDQSFDFQLTAAAQATVAALQAATQEVATQEAQVQLTRQAEYDQMCSSERYQRDEVSLIHLFAINFLPEFDQPAMLVIYQVTLSPSKATLPVELTFRIPAAAGEPNAVAVQDANGTLFDVAYTRTVQGEWAFITFTATTIQAQLEYYDPNLVIQRDSRHFEYPWQADYPADNVFIGVRQPAGARNMQISPQLYGPGLLNGNYYYCTIYGATFKPSNSLFTIDYESGDTP